MSTGALRRVFEPYQIKGVTLANRIVRTSQGTGITVGGRIGDVTVGGRMATRGDNLVTVEIDGELGSLRVDGGIHAEGRGSDAVRVRGKRVDPSNVVGLGVAAAKG